MNLAWPIIAAAFVYAAPNASPAGHSHAAGSPSAARHCDCFASCLATPRSDPSLREARQAAANPRVAARGAATAFTTLQLEFDGMGMFASVDIGGRLVRTMVDTGATLSSVPADFAGKLIEEGQAEEAEPMLSDYADGAKREVRTINVFHIALGGHDLWNQRFSVSAAYLLGFYQLHAAHAAVDAGGLQLIFLGDR